MAYLSESSAADAPRCPTSLPWDGQARMAYVRRAIGLPCTELDKEAMRRVPQDQAVW